MAATWREERPDAITAASHKAERPSRSMVMMSSALSSSSDARIRFRRSLCGAGALAGAAGFLGAGFLTDFLVDLGTAFLAGAFLAGAFLAGAPFGGVGGLGFFSALRGGVF